MVASQELYVICMKIGFSSQRREMLLFLTLTHHQHGRRDVMCKQEIAEINIGNARFHAQFMFDLHSFDQNIPSFENSLF